MDVGQLLELVPYIVELWISGKNIMPAQCPGNARPKTMRNRLVSIVPDAFWAQEKSENQNSFSSTRKVPKRPKRFTPC